MLTPLDDSPWHQLPTTFDHVGTSDVRFFDRLWFAASDRSGNGVFQFTIGVYQNMNVVDGGVVVIRDGRQHNVRASRQLRPDYHISTGSLRLEVIEPLRQIRLTIARTAGSVSGDVVWTATSSAQEEHHHFNRARGRVLEDYSRYDQIGELSGWLEVDGQRADVESWWACRDHSWGVRENVGIVEPFTGDKAVVSGPVFVFLFFSTATHSGHVQVTRIGGSSHLTAQIIERGADGSDLRVHTCHRIDLDAGFVDDARPRRFEAGTITVVDDEGTTFGLTIERQGPAVAMQGLGYGGYDDGRGLGVHRGMEHLEHGVWDVSHPAEVVLADGTTTRPVHRIQPVRLTLTGPDGTANGTGSLTCIAEADLDADGRLRVHAEH